MDSNSERGRGIRLSVEEWRNIQGWKKGRCLELVYWKRTFNKTRILGRGNTGQNHRENMTIDTYNVLMNN